MMLAGPAARPRLRAPRANDPDPTPNAKGQTAHIGSRLGHSPLFGILGTREVHEPLDERSLLALLGRPITFWKKSKAPVSHTSTLTPSSLLRSVAPPSCIPKVWSSRRLRAGRQQ